MICRDTPTHGWVCGWLGGWVSGSIGGSMGGVRSKPTQPPTLPPMGGGVSTNHKSSKRIVLSQLGQDLFNC